MRPAAAAAGENLAGYDFVTITSYCVRVGRVEYLPAIDDTVDALRIFPVKLQRPWSSGPGVFLCAAP
jgi:hypothetical protein